MQISFRSSKLHLGSSVNKIQQIFETASLLNLKEGHFRILFAFSLQSCQTSTKTLHLRLYEDSSMYGKCLLSIKALKDVIVFFFETLLGYISESLSIECIGKESTYLKWTKVYLANVINRSLIGTYTRMYGFDFILPFPRLTRISVFFV